MTWFEVVLSWMMMMSPNLVLVNSEIACDYRPCRCVSKFRVNCSHSLLAGIPSTVGEDADMLVLDASSNLLSSLNASRLPNQLKALILHNNQIRTLDTSDLHMLPALIFLHLDNNNISAIHSETLSKNKRIEILTLRGNHFQFSEEQNYIQRQPFLNAPGLRVLDISNCSFRMISGVMFAKLAQLEDLRLSYNRIQSLEEGTFQHLKVLKSLLLRRNLLNKIQKGAFNSLSKLQVLDLADNYLSFLDEPELFSPLITLRYLDLSGNGLKHLHQRIFLKLSSLKVLYLNGNLLKEFHENTFHGVPQLSVLDVSDNSLQCMPRHTMFCENTQLSYLKLSNSFMICDNCTVWNVWKWRDKRNITAFFAKCNGRDIDDFFNTYEKRQELLQSLTNCSLIPECESESFQQIPEPSTSSLYIYVITGTVFLLSGALVSLIFFHRYFRSKRGCVTTTQDQTNNQFTSKSEEPHISEELKKRKELHQKMEEERLKLQRELYFQHQKSLKRQQQLRYRETLERTRQERESTKRYDASRLPSVADDEKEWCRADTLPVKDKYKYIHRADKTVPKKTETRRYSVGEVIQDDYWHAKKNTKGSKSTDALCHDVTEVTFSQNDLPVYAEKVSNPVL